MTPTHQATEKIPTSKRVKKVEIYTCHPHPWFSTLQLGGNHQIPDSPWGAEFVPHSSVTTFKSATEGLDPKSPSSESQQSLLHKAN